MKQEPINSLWNGPQDRGVLNAQKKRKAIKNKRKSQKNARKVNR